LARGCKRKIEMTDAGSAASERSTKRVSLVGEFNVLLRHWRLLLILPLGGMIAATLFTMAFGQSYVAESRFMPQVADGDVSRLAGLAAQFGVNIGGQTDPAQSVDFYGELVESREILTRLAATEFRFVTKTGGADTITGTLDRVYGVEGRTAEDRWNAAAALLRSQVSVQTGLRSAGLVTVTTRAEWPDLAVQMNRRLLELVNDFNLRRRQSQAAAERRFVEGRLHEARRDVEAAEGALAVFLERNRVVESPQLRFQQDRLQSRVDLARQVYTGLARAYEEARIAEVRNTPVITVVDSPEGSGRRSQSLVFNALVGVLLGALAAVLLAFLADYIRRDRAEHPDAYSELRMLVRRIVTFPPASSARIL
jgi:uncharacterized protein involved in exopolysaccharide biosynthesis